MIHEQEEPALVSQNLLKIDVTCIVQPHYSWISYLQICPLAEIYL